MKHVAFWCGEPIDSLSREQRDEIRACFAEQRRLREEDWRRPFGTPPKASVFVYDLNTDEILRRLDELDYFDATQFTLLGAADDRLRQ